MSNPRYRRVNTPDANDNFLALRAGRDRNSDLVFRIPHNSRVEVTGPHQGQWMPVAYVGEDGQRYTGYVNRGYLVPDNGPSAPVIRPDPLPGTGIETGSLQPDPGAGLSTETVRDRRFQDYMALRGHNAWGIKNYPTSVGIARLRSLLPVGTFTSPAGEPYVTFRNPAEALAGYIIKIQAYIDNGWDTPREIHRHWAVPDRDHPDRPMEDVQRDYASAISRPSLGASRFANPDERIRRDDLVRILQMAEAQSCAENSQCSGRTFSEADRARAMEIIRANRPLRRAGADASSSVTVAEAEPSTVPGLTPSV